MLFDEHQALGIDAAPVTASACALASNIGPLLCGGVGSSCRSAVRNAPLPAVADVDAAPNPPAAALNRLQGTGGFGAHARSDAMVARKLAGNDVVAIGYKHVRKRLIDPYLTRSHLPSPMDDFCAANALDRFLEGSLMHPAPARESSATGRSRRVTFGRRRPGSVFRLLIAMIPQEHGGATISDRPNVDLGRHP